MTTKIYWRRVMSDLFYEKYKRYENYPIERLKHIPTISFYNHNYYFGIKREGVKYVVEKVEKSINSKE